VGNLPRAGSASTIRYQHKKEEKDEAEGEAEETLTSKPRLSIVIQKSRTFALAWALDCDQDFRPARLT
jgi:hypothetical protein